MYLLFWLSFGPGRSLSCDLVQPQVKQQAHGEGWCPRSDSLATLLTNRRVGNSFHNLLVFLYQTGMLRGCTPMASTLWCPLSMCRCRVSLPCLLPLPHPLLCACPWTLWFGDLLLFFTARIHTVLASVSCVLPTLLTILIHQDLGRIQLLPWTQDH